MRRAMHGALAFGLLTLAAAGCGSSDPTTASISTGAGENKGAVAEADADRAEAAKRLAATQREAFLNPVVEVETTKGAFKIKLNRAKAEKTVDNFLEYVAAGFYDNTIFHQVEKDFVVAAGGYTSDLRRKPTRVPIRNEAHNGLKNKRGTVAMVRSPSGIHTATSQFMINLVDNPSLDHQPSRSARRYDLDGEEPAALPAAGKDQYGFCVFGEVIEGWDTIEAIAGSPVKPSQHLASVPAQPVVIQSARRVK